MRVKVQGFWRLLRIMFFVALAVTAFGYLVMWLWNWLIPAIFGLHAINYWKALGLLVLCKILFGGFGGRHPFSKDWRARSTWNMSPEERAKCRTAILRWNEMTREERDKFRAEMYGGCGPSTPAPKP
jgi:hypothetical protein